MHLILSPPHPLPNQLSVTRLCASAAPPPPSTRLPPHPTSPLLPLQSVPVTFDTTEHTAPVALRRFLNACPAASHPLYSCVARTSRCGPPCPLSWSQQKNSSAGNKFASETHTPASQGHFRGILLYRNPLKGRQKSPNDLQLQLSQEVSEN